MSVMKAFLRLPFASQLQLTLLVLMIVGFCLIAQTRSMETYQIGLSLLTGAALLQMVVGNIPPEAGWWRTLKLLGIGLGIVAAVFALGILLVPYLARLGGGAGEAAVGG